MAQCALALAIVLVMAYLMARAMSYAYFHEKLQYHKRVLRLMAGESPGPGNEGRRGKALW